MKHLLDETLLEFCDEQKYQQETLQSNKTHFDELMILWGHKFIQCKWKPDAPISSLVMKIFTNQSHLKV